MLRNDFIYNCWQVYAEAQILYDLDLKESFRKLTLINDRQDVLSYKMYKYGSDVMFTAKTETFIYIVFLGSNDLLDWKNNFDFKLIDLGNNCKVHEGFYTSSMKFQDIIQAECKPYNSRNIVFVGHSRGGALAMTAGINYGQIYSTSNHLNIVTYGQPRVGNHNYIKLLQLYNITYCRVLFAHDIVCDLPPVELGYEHPWFGDKLVLQSSWWHNLPFMFKRVHLDYDRTINTKFVKTIYTRQDY